ncbi:STAS domain-containing protein [Streptomyces sp. NBC_01304]|uniref:STAS domain-containing protein n=1 Tax=Streptomyces sp. NBC_01304 TaxID=2903818 RepID=UPI002E0F5AE7|nr:STAS domain-containing protein [Streptomyces sp. NBC_01304]
MRISMRKERDPEPKLKVRSTSAKPGLYITFALSGELDSGSVSVLCNETSTAMAAGSRHVMLDLSRVTRCDNASLYTILGIRHALQHAGGSLTLTAPTVVVRDAVEGSGLGVLLTFTDQLEELSPLLEALEQLD